MLPLIYLREPAATGDATARRKAQARDEKLRVLSTFDESPDLVITPKPRMVLEGNPEYGLNLNPTDASASQKVHLEAAWRQFKTWYAGWAKA